jgi:hypothetical protein
MTPIIDRSITLVVKNPGYWRGPSNNISSRTMTAHLSIIKDGVLNSLPTNEN